MIITISEWCVKSKKGRHTMAKRGDILVLKFTYFSLWILTYGRFPYTRSLVWAVKHKPVFLPRIKRTEPCLVSFLIKRVVIFNIWTERKHVDGFHLFKIFPVSSHDVTYTDCLKYALDGETRDTGKKWEH